jgi:glycosyltransferase involved in cell wall biosynthesis
MAADITVVLNCHNEGRLVHATVRSVAAAIEKAESVGLEVEWLIVQDNASPDLLSYFDTNLPPAAKVMQVSLGDPGLARNAAAQAATGKYLTFVDGDDLFSSDWLARAHHFVQHFPKKCVVRSEWKIYFEGDNLFIRNVDQESLDFSLGTFMEHCDWNSFAFAERETYLRIPFQATDRVNGFGFEDNAWSCEIVAAGILNKVLPGTIHAIRIKTWKSSQNAGSLAEGCMVLPNSLFNVAYQNLNSKQKEPGARA